VSGGAPGGDGALRMAAGWSLWSGGAQLAEKLKGAAFTGSGAPLEETGPDCHVHACGQRTGLFIHDHAGGARPHDHEPPRGGYAGRAVPHDER